MKCAEKESILLYVILLVTALVYANSLHNPFITDDRHIILKNFQPWQSWTASDLFSRSLFSTTPSESSYFRPLTLLTFAINYPFAGSNPAGYRAVNVAIHLAVIVLIYLLLSQLAGKWTGLSVSLLYALHPVHVQAVSYISSRSDPLYTIFALSCLLFWRKGNETQGSLRTIYLSSALCAFFLGLFTKENIVVVPPIALVMDIIWNPFASWQQRVKENIGWYLGFALLFLIYFIIRVEADFPLSMEGGREFAWNVRIFYSLKLFALYLGLVFYPAHLSLFRVVPVPESFLQWQVILGSLFLVGMVITAWLLRKKYREMSFGLLWYLIAVAPILNLTLLNAPMMEHWLYFPLIGFTLAIVTAIRILAEKTGEMRGGALGLVFLTLLLSTRTVTRNAEWGDLVKLFSRDVAYYQGNWRAWSWYGDALKTQARLKDSIRAYRISLSMNPKQIPTWVALGETLSLAGEDAEAEHVLSTAVSVRPKESWFRYILAIHRLKVGKYEAAVEPLVKSIELQPSPMAYHALGSIYLRLGQKEQAEQLFSKATLLYPRQQRFHSGVHVDLGKLYLVHGKAKEAKEEWQLALRFEPNSTEARRLLQGQAIQ